MPPKQDESAALLEESGDGGKINPKSLQQQQQQNSYGASSTSFYTDERKRDTYESLHDVLESKCSNEKLRECIEDLMGMCADITEALRSTLVHVEGSTNDFGDTQLSVDVSLLVACCCIYTKMSVCLRGWKSLCLDSFYCSQSRLSLSFL